MDYWTLGAMSDANILLSAWCQDCRHRNHIDPVDLINRPALSPFVYVRELREKIVCSEHAPIHCGKAGAGEGHC